ncbi:MAG TPA: adenosylcobinamide-phosphate synthase CbiB [Streptosporangiaceae bacterium]|nr:adenosylcobinamide-phosphate synthase CbiB [Streptosporangiaceae bacterium]
MRRASSPPPDAAPHPWRARYAGRDWPLASGLIGGAIADAIAGDPAHGHPVALFGQLMTAVEQRVYADRADHGVAYAATGFLIAAGPLLGAARLTRTSPAGRAAVTAATAWAAIASRSLGAAARQVGAALEAGDLGQARAALPSLCGRDPQDLDGPGIARAVVESVAENTSDAIVAPLVWGALAGPAGLSGYRAVNTMDAMAGHHSPRYERFGKASARLDDVANWVPARVTALLAAACSPAVGGRPGSTWQTARDYGPSHPSPNAGWCEAAFAGALGIRLGGVLAYSGRTEHRPQMGTGGPPLAGDIGRAIRLSRAVTASATALAAALAAGSSGHR